MWNKWTSSGWKHFLPIFLFLASSQAFPQSGSENCDYWGNATYQGRAVVSGDVIRAYDPQGVLCGTYYTISGGMYCYHVRGDDPTSPEDEGAVANDVITFKINGKTAVVSGAPNKWTNLGSIQIHLNVPLSPPDAPGNLNASAVSDVRIDLTWQDNSGDEDGFKVERKKGVSGTWSQITTVGANTTSYDNDGLNSGTKYYYRVRAYNSGGNSNYSNTDNATTHSVPSAPSSLTASTASTSQINLGWNDNSGNEDGFKIERKTGSSGTWSQIATVGSGVEGYQNTGLLSGTTYYYRVRAYNTLGNSGYSNVVNAKTGSLPEEPSNLSASSVSTSQIDLSWNDNSSNESGFKIFRKTGSGGSWSQIATVNANKATFGNTGLSSGITYYYRIRAYNTWGQSDYSNVDDATTQTPLAGPSGLTASVVSSSKINLSWNDNAGNESGFKIERKVGDSGSWSQIATVGENTTSYSNSGLTQSTLYKYRIRAYNASMQSSYSNIAEGVTQGPPVKPNNLAADVVSTSRIDLSWQDKSVNEEGFKVERKTGAGGTWTEIVSVSDDTEFYEDTNLDSGTTYYYRVKAYNGWGNSAYTSEISATTGMLPAKPTGLAATAEGVDRILLSWQDNADNEKGFKLERKKGSNGTWNRIAILNLDDTDFNDEGLLPNTTYSYRVKSYNAWGHSDFSDQVSATTMAIAPPYINQCYPPNGAKAVPQNAKIRFQIREQGYGLDMDEFHVWVNGASVVSAGQDQTNGDVVIQTSGAGLSFCYDPSLEFTAESSVSVNVQYQDTASPPNASDTSYTFNVIGYSVFETQNESIGSGGGTVIDGFSGLELHFPAGALSGPTDIGIGIVKSPPELPEGVIYHSLVYHFSPEGMEFEDSVTVSVPYTPNDLANAGVTNPLDLPVYYFSTLRGIWIQLHLFGADDEFVYTKVKEFCYLIFSKTSGLHEDEMPVQQPGAYHLHQNYPNPFNPSTTLAYEIQEDGFVNMAVADILGRTLKILVSEKMSPGSYRITWDGTNENGSMMGNGTYLIIMQVNDFRTIRKVTLLK